MWLPASSAGAGTLNFKQVATTEVRCLAKYIIRALITRTQSVRFGHRLGALRQQLQGASMCVSILGSLPAGAVISCSFRLSVNEAVHLVRLLM